MALDYHILLVRFVPEKEGHVCLSVGREDRADAGEEGTVISLYETMKCVPHELKKNAFSLTFCCAYFSVLWSGSPKGQ